MTLTIGSLFSGIGGIDLGLERAGMRVVWQSEVDPYACRVLAKHWPHVPNLGDITKIDWSSVEPPDLVCGGYPCQPFSLAGTRNGETDPRHLWPHMWDALRHLRPRWALLENVPGHLSLGFGRVLGDLAELGYDCEWDCIPAAAVGAPHLRYRVFVVAHADGEGKPGVAVDAVTRRGVMVPDADGGRCRQCDAGVGRLPVADAGGDVADPGEPRRRQDPRSAPGDEGADARRAAADDHVADGDGQSGRARAVGDTDSAPADSHPAAGRPRRTVSESGWWAVEPDVGRVAHGVPNRVDRLRTLGNAVVPQVAEWIGRRIVEATS